MERIDRATAANVLYEAGERGSHVFPPSGFYGRLIQAAFKADLGNLKRIARGFPAVAEAVRLYKQDSDRLRAIARGWTRPEDECALCGERVRPCYCERLAEEQRD